MPANLKDPFGPSCCDGGAMNNNDMSAMPCGCDPQEGWLCNTHRIRSADNGTMFALADEIARLRVENEDLKSWVFTLEAEIARLRSGSHS